MRLGETNTLALLPALYLFSIESYWQKRTVTLWRHNVTSDDLSRGNWCNSATGYQVWPILLWSIAWTPTWARAWGFSHYVIQRLCPSRYVRHTPKAIYAYAMRQPVDRHPRNFGFMKLDVYIITTQNGNCLYASCSEHFTEEQKGQFQRWHWCYVRHTINVSLSKPG